VRFLMERMLVTIASGVYSYIVLGFIVVLLVTWTVPSYLEKERLQFEVENMTGQMIFLQKELNRSQALVQNYSSRIENLQMAGQFFYNEASQLYKKWQAERLVAWSLLMPLRDAANLTPNSSEYINMVVPRWHYDRIEEYIAEMNLSYDDLGNITGESS